MSFIGTHTCNATQRNVT